MDFSLDAGCQVDEVCNNSLFVLECSRHSLFVHVENPFMPARLTLREGAAQPSQVEIANESSITIGRRRENDIVIMNTYTSRWHARIYHEMGNWLLLDTSHNGTEVNGEVMRGGPITLANGAVISIHKTKFVFQIEPD